MLRKLTQLTSITPIIRRFSKISDELIVTSDEVTQSMLDSRPLVALESTVITHGMPWPVNFETAVQLEEIVREEGAIPVTIGVFNGKIIAGFTKFQLEELSKSIETSNKPVKVSRHNIYNCRNIKYGGTTVSGTMIVARKLGINIFGTGGIGGVHREVESTMDISTDLRELGRTPICVVSAGMKSFLDIPKTLEFLETEGVFVCTLNSKVFPNFFTRSSGIKSPNNIKSIEEIAQIVSDMTNFKLKSGMLVAVPIPECLEKDGSIIQQAIVKSLENAKSAKITGSYVSPFVLNQINMLTHGKSLTLNIELIKNNVRVAAKLSQEFEKLKTSNSKHSETKKRKSPIAVIGGCLVDNCVTIKDPSVVSLETIIPRGTYDCSNLSVCGGVGRNIAEVFSQLNEKCHFLSILGKDYHGEFIKKNSKNLDFSRVIYSDNLQTGNCSVITCENREILFHIGDLSIFQNITRDYLETHLEEIKSDLKLICLDCNLPENTMKFVIEFAKTNNIKTFLEPTDILLVNKPLKLVENLKRFTNPIDIISPNIFEFFEILKLINEDKNNEYNLNSINLNQIGLFEKLKMNFKNSNLLDLIPIWLIKLGQDGVIFASKDELFFIKQSIFFVPKRNIINTSGAGDCLAGCALLLHLNTNLSWKDTIAGSLRLVKESLIDNNTVPTKIDFNNYTEFEIQKWTKEMFDKKLLFYRE